VDRFAVVVGCPALAARLGRVGGVRYIELVVWPATRVARLELRWRGSAEDAARAAAWDRDAFAGDDERGRLTLAEVAARHGGEQWTGTDRGEGTVSYSLLLPVARSAPAPVPVSPQPGRPEFYDFDLFKQPGQTSELGRRPLTELSYTVFDTETTGLDPSAGDEIISISAVRIVNGRLLRSETFDQLVDPQRPLSRSSIAIHGITPAMLQGQPPIGQVLPRFARFAEDTVLVGHNVAFDMRFLQLKESVTGVRFIQPVLDTLLLSAVVHPNMEEHALEANARRFGIPVIGRHTSLGDAIVTGEIFMKLVPLLAGRGIATLGDAIAASERTYLARIKY
jgi:DNA polymerase-3 subunit epsilon